MASKEVTMDPEEIARIQAIVAEMPIHTREMYFALSNRRKSPENSEGNNILTLDEMVKELGNVKKVVLAISQPAEITSSIGPIITSRVYLVSDPSVRMSLLFEQAINGKGSVDLKEIADASISLLDESMKMRNSKEGTPGCIAGFMAAGNQEIRQELGILSDVHIATMSGVTSRISTALNQDVLSCQHMYEFLATKANLN